MNRLQICPLKISISVEGTLLPFQLTVWWWQVKYFEFSPLLSGEIIQGDEHLFQLGWVQSPTSNINSVPEISQPSWKGGELRDLGAPFSQSPWIYFGRPP